MKDPGPQAAKGAWMKNDTRGGAGLSGNVAQRRYYRRGKRTSRVGKVGTTASVMTKERREKRSKWELINKT